MFAAVSRNLPRYAYATGAGWTGLACRRTASQPLFGARGSISNTRAKRYRRHVDALACNNRARRGQCRSAGRAGAPHMPWPDGQRGVRTVASQGDRCYSVLRLLRVRRPHGKPQRSIGAPVRTARIQGAPPHASDALTNVAARAGPHQDRSQSGHKRVQGTRETKHAQILCSEGETNETTKRRIQ